MSSIQEPSSPPPKKQKLLPDMVVHKTNNNFQTPVFRGTCRHETFFVTSEGYIMFVDGFTIKKAKLQFPYNFTPNNIIVLEDHLFVMFPEHIIEYQIGKDNEIKEIQKIEVDCPCENDDISISNQDEDNFKYSAIIDMHYSLDHGSLFTLIKREYNGETFSRVFVQMHNFVDFGKVVSREQQIPWTKDLQTWMDPESGIGGGYGGRFFIAGNLIVVDGVVFKLHFIKS